MPIIIGEKMGVLGNMGTNTVYVSSITATCNRELAYSTSYNLSSNNYYDTCVQDGALYIRRNPNYTMTETVFSSGDYTGYTVDTDSMKSMLNTYLAQSFTASSVFLVKTKVEGIIVLKDLTSNAGSGTIGKFTAVAYGNTFTFESFTLYSSNQYISVEITSKGNKTVQIGLYFKKCSVI